MKRVNRPALALERLEQRTLLSGPHQDDAPFQFVPEQRHLMVFGGFLTEPPADPTAAIDVAMDFLSRNMEQLGMRPGDMLNPLVTDQYVSEGSGTTHIYLLQQHGGLPIKNATMVVNVSSRGQVINAGGSFIGGLERGDGGMGGMPDPALPAADAVVTAARHFNLEVLSVPVVIHGPAGLDQATLLEDKEISLDAIPARLAYVAMPDGLRLAWDIVIRTPDGSHWVNLAVDATTGDLIFESDWVDDAAAYRVYPMPLENPNEGPRSLIVNPADPAASPFGWQDLNGIEGADFSITLGNNVTAQEDADANNAGGLRPDAGPGLQFDFPLNLSLAPSTYQAAAITNLFYWNNILHDVHLRFGFTEAAGNFQQMNYTGQGAGRDPVIADAQDGAGTNNANFSTPPDGHAPRMQQYIWTHTNPGRDSDLDHEVIIHEYGHGVSNRLTGGPANSNALNATQSGGMGEGWSDWWAIMITQKPADSKNGSYPIGTYLLGQSASGKGIRRYPYSYDMSVDPLNFSHYNSDSSKQVHRTGEIWSSTLWDLNWLLIDKYGYDPDLYTGYSSSWPGNAGNKLALRLVMDGLKLQPATPSFIDARNAILAADVALTGGANQREIWTAFARRSLGYNAATAGANAGTVTLATDLPPAMANPGVVAQNPVGVVHAAPGSIDLTFSESMDQGSFDPQVDVISFVDPGNNDYRNQITGYSWLNDTTLRVDFNSPAVQGRYTITLGPDILAAGDGSPLDQNTNGTAGEIINDRFIGSFHYDAVAMQVASTSPANASTVSLPFTSIDVNFNEPYAPGTIGTDDLQMTSGTVVGFSFVDTDTVRYKLAGVTDLPTLTLNIKAGSVTDPFGYPVAAYSGSFTVTEIGTIAYPLPLEAIAPLGSLIYDPAVFGVINAAGDTDSFTIQLDAGQTVSLVAAADPLLRAAIELRDSSNLLLASQAGAQGQRAVIQSVPITAPGLYTVHVAGADSTTGGYSAELFLNAAVERENHGGPGNSSLATSQSIAGSFVSLNGTAQIASILGTTDRNLTTLDSEVEPNNTYAAANDATANFTSFTGSLYHMAIAGNIADADDTDYFSIGTLQPGDFLTITSSGSPTWRGSLRDPFIELYRAGSPDILADDDDNGPDTDALIHRFAITEADTYFVRATKWSTFTGTYSLAVFLEDNGTAPWTGGTLLSETEPNDSVAAANDASTSWRPVQYRSRTAGSITAGDSDTLRFEFKAGDLVTVLIDSLSTLDAQVAVFDSKGQTIGFENGTSVGPGADSPIYGIAIPGTGTYYVQVTGLTGTGAYNADVIISSSSSPPAASAGADFYSFTLAQGQSATVALEKMAAGIVNVAILDSTGAVQATGQAGPSNFYKLIENYAALSGGTYHVRVTGASLFDYSLVVTRGATFDAEGNNSFTAAQSLGPGLNAAGHVGSDDDWFQFPVTVCDLLTITTATPGGGANEFLNTLDPAIELFDPNGQRVASDDNSGSDGKNASVVYRVPATGTYRVLVRGVSSSGEYALAVARQSCNIRVTGGSVINSSPADGEQLFAAVTYDTFALPATASYAIEFKLDGVPVNLPSITSGAGADSGSWNYQAGGWILTPGNHTLTITVDPANTVAESDETDNTVSVTFTASPPTTLPNTLSDAISPYQSGQFAVVNYSDVDPRPGVAADFRAGPFANDSHIGLDVAPANFSQMDAGLPIFAVAPGTVISTSDGLFDRETAGGLTPGNSIQIDHGNGWRTSYRHLLAGSVAVQPGQSVSAGQLIGLLGSSGGSTGPHAHVGLSHHGFDVEPFQNIPGYFAVPLPLYQGDQPRRVQDSGVTNYNVSTDLAERPSGRYRFLTTESSPIIYWYRLSHLKSGDELRVKWYRPDGSLQAENSFNATVTERYLAQSWSLDPAVWSVHSGVWQVAVVVNGIELARSSFEVIGSGLGVPEIRLRETGGRLIPDGRTSALAFGSIDQGGVPATQTVQVENYGSDPLLLSGVQLPPGFSLVGSLPSSIGAGGTALITIQLDSGVPGKKFGVVRLDSNDLDEGRYEFNISGVVVGTAATGTPVLTLPGPALAYQAGLPARAVHPSATFADSDSIQFAGGQIRVEFASGSRAGDRLTIIHQGNGAGQVGTEGSTVRFGGTAIGSFSPGDESTPLIVSLNADASVAAVQAILRAAAYSNVSAVSPAPRYVRFTVTDETGKVSNQPIAVVISDAVPAITTTVFVDANGNLTIRDVHAGSKANQFSVTFHSDQVVLNDASGWFSKEDASAITGAVLSDGDRTLTVPLASFSGGVTVQSGRGNDSISFAPSAGSQPWTRAVAMDGGDGADSIAISTHVAIAGAGAIDLTGELVQLGGNLGTDGGHVHVAGDVVLATSSIMVDTEVGNDGTPGTVRFTSGSISAAGSDYDIVVNTSTTGSAAAGSIQLSGFGAAAGHAVRNLSAQATSGGGPAGDVTFLSDLAVRGTIDVAGNSINVAGTISSNSNAITLHASAMVSFSGPSAVVNAGTAPVTLISDANGTGGIVSGSAAADVVAATLKITAGSGGIGASGNPLAMDVAQVTASTGGNGPAYLIEADGATIGVEGIDTGTGAITFGGGTFTLGGASRLADSAPIVLSSGATLDLNGLLETIGSLAGSGNVLLGAATLTTGADNTHSVFSGAISGLGGLTKIGTGSFYLRGASTYDGETVIKNGSVLASADQALGSTVGGTTVAAAASARLVFDNRVNYTAPERVAINGSGFNSVGSLAGVGNVKFAGPITLNSPSTMGAYPAGSTFTLSGPIDTNGHTLITKGTAALVFDGSVSGSGGIDKQGVNTLVLAASNSYTGGTAVQAGTMSVTGSNSSSPTVVQTAAIVSGTGTLGPVSANGGEISPAGAGFGILSGVDANFGSSGILRIQIQGYTTAGVHFDRLNLAGTMTAGGASKLSLDLAGLATTGIAAGVVTYANVFGPFSTVELLNNPNRYTACLTYGPTSLDISIQDSACGTWAAVPADESPVDVRDLLSQPIRTWSNASRPITIASLDTGVDYTHPALYRSIWLNEREIPESVRMLVRDRDGDRRITLRDLNRRANQGPDRISDLNGNGVIDGFDVLLAWSDGRDDDGNGYVDDLIGWDFVNNDNDPMDDSGHGTHGAGVLVQVARRAEVVSLKFLDSSAGGSLGDAERALAYALEKGITISSNGWAATAYSDSWRAKLMEADAVGHLFVTAAGNGDPNLINILARLQVGNMLVVGARDARGGVASFSNWDTATVDLAVPGVGLSSLVPGGGQAARSGTSVASAFAAASAGILHARQPNLTTTELVDAILREVRYSSTMTPSEPAQRPIVLSLLNRSELDQPDSEAELRRRSNVDEPLETPGLARQIRAKRAKTNLR